MRKLTPKQGMFVAEYLVDLNATQAAIRAGYSPVSARQVGAENMTKPYIAAEIEKAIQKRMQRTEVTADKVVKELARLAFSDMRSYTTWGPDGVAWKESEELSADDSAAVTEVSLTPNQYGDSLKIKLGHKDSALRLLAEHTGVVGSFAGGMNVQVNVDNRATEDREERFERLFAALDEYRAEADEGVRSGDRSESVDTNGSRT